MTMKLVAPKATHLGRKTTDQPVESEYAPAILLIAMASCGAQGGVASACCDWTGCRCRW